MEDSDRLDERFTPRTLPLIFATLILMGCGSPGDDSASSGLGVDSELVEAVEAFEIEAVEYRTDPDAPAWCNQLLSEDLRSLPAAMLGIGDAEFSDELAGVFTDAAGDLRRVAGDVPENVEREVVRLAIALEEFPVEEPRQESFEHLGSALDSLSAETAECGYR